jgi:hypothetical protein
MDALEFISRLNLEGLGLLLHCGRRAKYAKCCACGMP